METIPQLSNVVRSINTHPVTWLIILISCIPFVLLTSENLNAISMWFMPDTLGELIQPFSVWHLWTPTFIHYTLLHLLTNLYLWWLFASKIELDWFIYFFIIK